MSHPRSLRRGRPGLLLSSLVVLNALHAHGATFAIGDHTFTLPDGFHIERVAGPDLIPRPVSASFDPEGGLFVTDSAGINSPPSEQLKDPRNRILRLVDTNGDGRFDRATVFAEGVMFPQGCLWHDGSVYVAGPPSIWKFTDTDGDGVADRREEWYRGEVLTGCANDVHGPYLGPEGMLYWTKGAFARLDLRDHTGRHINDRCAHIFRARPDGSGFEVVASGGMDNPVEVAFTPEGEPILISTFLDLSQPGRRDGLAHAVYGGVFGKANDALEEPMVRRTGGLLPAMTHYGPAAACALTRYEGDAFGPEFRDNLFATLFNLRKVTRHVLKPSGSTYVTEDSDFLVSDHMDFRPTDVLQDADGSLLVVDTGGWYKLCCPSSQLAKADVLGGIYRIRRMAPEGSGEVAAVADRTRFRPTDPPGLRADSREAELKRLAIAARAESAPRLRAALREATAALERSPGSGLDSPARLARIAAEGLGRVRDREAVPLLFEALRVIDPQDRFLEHSLLFALIEIGDAEGTRRHAEQDNARLRRAALLVLEQIEGGSLRADAIAPHLAADDDALRETAHWIARRHPEWGADLVAHVRGQLSGASANTVSPAARQELLGLLARDSAGRDFIAEVVSGREYPAPTRVAALGAMASAPPRETPSSWRAALRDVLTRPGMPPEIIAVAVRTVRALSNGPGDPVIREALARIASDSAHPVPMRLDAVAALPDGSEVEDGVFDLLRDAAAPDAPAGQRTAAANSLGRLRLSEGQLRRLLPALSEAGPLELPRLLPAFASGRDPSLGEALLDALEQSRALRSLRPEDLKTHLRNYPATVTERAARLLQSLATDAEADLARLDSILAEVTAIQGDIRRGQAIFNSARTACSTCHRMGYLGGDVGPDLTSIGTIRSERDLLEAVLFPSASFVRSYEPWTAVVADGEEYTGVLRRETPEAIVLATGPGSEVRLDRSSIVELRPGTVSTMPAGLEEQLTREELADLLTFLKNTRWGAN